MKKSRQEALKKLKQVKSGKESRVSQYKVLQSKDLLIEMPEEEYKALVAQRNKQKFIVDDIGIGYDDQGEFDLNHDQDEEAYEEEDEKIDSNQYGPNPITNFFRGGLDKKPKLPPRLKQEERSLLKASLIEIIENDAIDVDDILQDKKVPLKKINNGIKTVSKNQSEEKFASQYNIPVGKLLTNTPPIQNTPPPIQNTPLIKTIPPIQTIQKTPLIKTIPPIQTIQKTPLIKTIPPIQTIQNTSPIQTIPPIQNTSPIQTIPPIQNTSPIQTIPPIPNTYFIPDNSENRKRKAPGAEFNPIKQEEIVRKLDNISEPEFCDYKNHIYKNYIINSNDNQIPAPEVEKYEMDPVEDTLAQMDLDANTIKTLPAIGTQEIPLESDGSLHLYWIDAFEYKDTQPGSVCIFGKVYFPSLKQHIGACVLIQEITRSFYVLPKPEYANKLIKVDEELEYYRKRFNIRKWSKAVVTKKYAFEFNDVPAEAQYLEVKYSSKFSPIEFSSLKTIARVFGAKTDLIETLMVEKKLKGPCWIKIKDVLQCKSKISNCAVDLTVLSYDSISYGLEESNKPAPPLIMVSLAIKNKTYNNTDPEILAVSGTVHKKIDQIGLTTENKSDMSYFIIINRSKQYNKAGLIETVNTENELLKNLLEKIKIIDPDIIAGHDLLSDMLKKLISRMHHSRVPNWSYLSRISQKNFPMACKDSNSLGNWKLRLMTAGRLLLDTTLSSQELLKETTYTLTSLVKKLFSQERSELEFELNDCIDDNAKAKIVATHTKQDSLYVHRIVCDLNIIPLTKQLSNIAGNLWARSLQNQRAERNEMLLIHKFYEFNYIIPDKTDKKFEEKAEKKKNQYSGGLVLTPISGLYDKFVILLDFNSLYPSIIREFNICFTTVFKPEQSTEEIDNRPGELNKQADPGILPEIIKDLVERRRSVKSALKNEKNETRKKQLDIKQQALKLTANSLYGCLGFKQSRFYARAIAALITQLGRNTLENTVKIAKDNLSLEVIYGDTDSIMINTNLPTPAEAVKKADELKKIVNKQFKHLEIEVDGIFKTMLLLKKKKYAAVKIDNGVTKREVKGLDMVRRDWSLLSKKVSSDILNLILSDYSKEEIAENIKAYIEIFMEEYDNSPLGDFIIYKQLTKPTDKYKDAKNQPHVSVARRLEEKGEKNIQKHFIPYIICEGSSDDIGSRAHHPDEVKKSSGTLKPDKRWYITQQIIPPIQRLISPIEFIKIEEIVELFGEDTSKYRSYNYDPAPIFNYSGVDVTITCPNNHPQYNLIKEKKLGCPQCDDKDYPAYASNATTLFLKKKMNLAYTSPYKCKEFNCGNTSRARNSTNCNKPDCGGKMVQTYTIKNFHKELHDLNKFEKQALDKKDWKKLKSKQIIEISAYGHVNLTKLIPKGVDYNNLFS